MTKTEILYNRWDPNLPGARYVAIQTNTDNPYVLDTYFTMEEVPQLDMDVALLNRDQAFRLFKFKKANLSEMGQ